MRLDRAAIGFVAALLLCATPTLALDMDINLILGSRSLSDDSIQVIDDQFFTGIDLAFGVGLNHLEVVAGFYASGDDTTQLQDSYEFDLFEASIGVLLKDRYGMFRPFLGGGLSAVRAETDINVGSQDFSADDTVGGLYLSGGAYWRLGSHFNIGISARALMGADVDFDFDLPSNLEQEANYFQIGLLLGWGLPGENN